MRASSSQANGVSFWQGKGLTRSIAFSACNVNVGAMSEPTNDAKTDFLIDRPEGTPADAPLSACPGPLLVLAHGAGGAMDSPFMTGFAAAAAGNGLTVVRFEFPYMAQRRTGGSKRPPPPIEQSCAHYKVVLTQLREDHGISGPLAFGGKSMGCRAASMIADEEFAAGRVSHLICLGYPFHPQGKPAQLRTAHLEHLTCPTLILQGERDPVGNRKDVATYTLSDAITLHWIGDGDHDFGPRGRSGFTKKGNIVEAATAVAEFVMQR